MAVWWQFPSNGYVTRPYRDMRLDDQYSSEEGYKPGALPALPLDGEEVDNQPDLAE